jgi:hypothetical protein
MKRFFFDLVSEFTAHDCLGHQCATRKEADHARCIAQRIGAEKPHLVKSRSYIRVRDETGAEIFEAPMQPGYVSSLT